MALGWRFYARRFGGDWLWVDVPMSGRLTEELSGPGMFTGTIPTSLDQDIAEDGAPMWVERGTLLYAERGEHLWAGVCTHQAGSSSGRDIEAVGLTGAYQWMPFDGQYRAWAPDPFDVVDMMLTTVADRHDNGDLGFTIDRVNDAPRGAGDERPAEPRPPKPPRRDGETKEHYDDRLLSWQIAVDTWQDAYAEREPYELQWWDSPYIGRELDELAQEIPFDYRGRYEWVDRAALTTSHVLELGGTLGERRQDLRLVDGVNLRERPQPESNSDGYANDVVVLGAGEGRDMRRGRAAVLDGRILTVKYVSAKDVRKQRRLDALANRTLKSSRVVTTLDTVVAWDTPGMGSLGTLAPGDEVWVESRFTTPAYAAWRRVASLTRSTDSTAVQIQFQAGEDTAT